MTTRVRLFGLLVTIGTGLCLFELSRLANSRGGFSSLMTGAFACGSLMLIASLLLTCGPRRWVLRIHDAFEPVRKRFLAAPVALRLPIACGLCGGAVALMLQLQLAIVNDQPDPHTDDQQAYLDTASEIHADGGPFGLLRDLYAGTFAEANRHPLYLGLLSVKPTLHFGQRLSIVIGIVTLAILTWGTLLVFGPGTAVLFVLLLATNAAFLNFTCRVVSEGLMIFCTGAIWLLIASRNDREGTATTMWMTPRFASALGVGCGLAYLTKGTGLVLLIGLCGWLVFEWVLRWRAERRTVLDQRTSPKRFFVSMGVLFLTFALVASPLLTRNVKRFGQPLYNVNSLLLFADVYEELPRMVADGTTTGEAANAFFARHSLSELIAREASGLVWETFILIRSLGPLGLGDARILIGGPLCLLAMLTMAVHWRPSDRLLLVWLVIHLGLYAWYVPIAAGERFVIPLLAPLLITASEGMSRWLSFRFGSNLKPTEG